jgi:hypothetical protein
MIRFQLAVLLLGLSLLPCNQSLLGQGATGEFRTSDGGTRETLESIFIPPIRNAPFSLTLETEWSRPLNGGGSFTVVNRRHIMRDSAGRIYQERWVLVPKGGKIESTMNWIQIADPEQHFYYNCRVENKTCTKLPYGDSTTTVYKPLIGSSGPLSDGSGFQKHEDLGTGSTEGITTVGYRDTMTINPGVFGNDQPMTTTREFWYAPKLGFNLVSTLDSPQAGKQVFTVTEISTDEPDTQFFSFPDGYSVMDTRGRTKPQE